MKRASSSGDLLGRFVSGNDLDIYLTSPFTSIRSSAFVSMEQLTSGTRSNLRSPGLGCDCSTDLLFSNKLPSASKTDPHSRHDGVDPGWRFHDGGEGRAVERRSGSHALLTEGRDPRR